MKRKIFLLTTAVLLLTVLFSQACPAFAATASDARESVVYIQSTDGKNSAGGTGFAIGKKGKKVQYIATNYHVVQLSHESGGPLTVVFNAATNDFVLGEVYSFNKEKDLAVVKLPEPTDKRKACVISPKDKTVTDGETFTAFGFPVESAIENVPKLNSEAAVSTTGGISTQVRSGTTELYALDLIIDHGNSGGPLVNSKGQVVGINTLSAQFSSDTNVKYFAIVIDELLKIIDRNEIPITVAGDNSTEIVIYIVAGVLLILIAVIAVLVLTRLNGKKANGRRQQTPVQPAPVMLLCRSGILSGRSFRVGAGTIIGRDPNRCKVVYPPDTPGVSGVHCEIIVTDHGIFVKDLNSSYGTFLSNGVKIAPGSMEKLNNGATFYLASQENTFEIRM